MMARMKREEATAALFQHAPCDRVDGSRKGIVDAGIGKNCEQSSRQHEHGKEDVLHGFGKLQASEKKKFAERVGDQESRVSLGESLARDDRSCRWFSLRLRFRLAWRIGEGEAHIR